MTTTRLRTPSRLLCCAAAAAFAFAPAWPHRPARAEDRAAEEKPAAKADAKADIPSPADLMRQLREERDRKAKQHKIAHFDLSDPIDEKPADFSLFGDDRLVLRTLVERIHNAKADAGVKGILLTVGDSGLSLAQATEVRDALLSFRKAGKRVFVYADSYDTVGYTLASGASDVCMLEGGEIMIPGIGIETMFAKGLLDKVGVKADYVQVGEYKGADEQYTRTEASPELRGEMKRLTEAMYDEIVGGIAAARKLPKELVRQTIDESIVSGKNAKARGLVDHLIDQDGLRELMAKKLGSDVDLLKDYGKAERDGPELDFSSPMAILQSLAKPPAPPESAKPAVAVVYAQGVITDGETGGDILFGDDGIGSENIRVAMRLAARDPNVKAIVIRIDSPGGSALASEVMWQAVRRAAAKKPVVISIGGMAASGGYYLAVAGDKIYADHTAVIGSIGVVGGKFVFKDLFDKLGLKTETFAKGRNAGMWSSSEPWTDKQREMVRNWMTETYGQFTDRVMQTRKGKIKDVDQVARGRIFLARQAKELGMVDELGGVTDAIADAAGRGGLKAGEYDVQVLPRPKTLSDYLNGTADDKANGPAAALPAALRAQVRIDAAELLPVLNVLSPSTRQALARQVRVMQLLQDRPVILAAPYTITVK